MQRAWLVSRVPVVLLVAVCVSLAAGETPEPRKKLVELGWDIPSTRYLRDNWQTMEQGAPFDGVIFMVRVQGANSEAFWDNKPWKKEWLEEALGDLKACRFSRFTDNFVRVNVTPGSLDWFSDADWAVLAEKTRLVAWLAREGGCKGICLDPESYGSRQFRYDPEKKRSFTEGSAMASKRGAQFAQALAGEFPKATVLSLWLNSILLRAGELDDPRAALEADAYGLLPAFIDGMLSAAPPEMTLVDGCENAYRFDGETAYLEAYNRMRSHTGPAMRLVAPENRARYRAQVQAGFGFYLDCYLNLEGNPWYIGAKSGSRLERLQQNLAAARNVTDQYVWVYGEQCCWWQLSRPSDWFKNAVKNTPGKGRLWEEAMPGIARAIRRAGDLTAAVRAELAERKAQGGLKNLVENPGFEEGDGPLPKGFSAWQADDSKGTFSADRATGHNSRASAKAVNVKNGCFIQKHNVKAGETYAVEADCLRKGAGTCSMRVRWQKANGQWTLEEKDKAVAFVPADGTWEHAFGVVTVPEGAEILVILLCVVNQSSNDDACWFDDVGLYGL
ncbi:MAG: carbohydrate binding domain-containing protein [Planctomycetota bacterium]|nr:carbohydrate binding domain-containing protein [Planctomycetota bacterium]